VALFRFDCCSYSFDNDVLYRCLDALGIAHGPTHAEVMMLADGPCLVEVGARFHGVGATWVLPANECIGYNQVKITSTLAMVIYIINGAGWLIET
jgi:hypothetical protein